MPVSILVILASLDEEDRAFIESLYADYNKLMRWTAYNIIHTQNELDDIVADVCVVLVRKVSVVRSLQRNALKSYIITTTKNVTFEHIRAGMKNANVLTDDILDEMPSLQPTPLEQMVSASEIDMLASAIEKLPWRDQEVLRMKYIAEMTDAQIAEAMDVKTVSVRSILLRAKQRAYKLMKEDEYEQ